MLKGALCERANRPMSDLLPPSVVPVVPIGTRYGYKYVYGYYLVLPGTNQILIPTTAGSTPTCTEALVFLSTGDSRLNNDPLNEIAIPTNAAYYFKLFGSHRSWAPLTGRNWFVVTGHCVQKIKHAENSVC